MEKGNGIDRHVREKRGFTVYLSLDGKKLERMWFPVPDRYRIASVFDGTVRPFLRDKISNGYNLLGLHYDELRDGSNIVRLNHQGAEVSRVVRDDLTVGVRVPTGHDDHVWVPSSWFSGPML